MDLIDDRGRLFGLVNVVDAFVVLVVAAALIAGLAFVLQDEPEPAAPPQTVTERAVLDLGRHPGYVVEQIQVGDTYSPAANTDITVTDIYLVPEGDGARVLLGVELTSPASGTPFTYDGAPLRIGRDLSVQTDTYQVSGVVRRVGTSEPRGKLGIREVTLTLRDVPPFISKAIQPGMTETAGEITLARITEVERTPSTILVTGGDGNVYQRDHPTHVDLTITAEFAVREKPTGTTFKGHTVERGSTVVLDLGNVTIEPTITSL